MRLWVCLLITVFSCLLSANLQAETSSDNAAEATGGSSQPVAGQISVGPDVYGTPILSDIASSGEIYGSKVGYFHPFLSLGGFYTDNLFNTDSDEKSDWVAVATPGIWIARPASRQKLVDINTVNSAPGGLALSRFDTEPERRIQTYGLYRADIRKHEKFTDEDRVDHRAEGLFRLALRGGLSLQIADVYAINREPYGTGGTPTRKLDKYNSNLFNTNLSYKLSPKLEFRADYSNFHLNYDANRNEFRNRDDNSVDAYIFYSLTPKTSFFLQTEFIWIKYDEDINSDSDEINYFAGVQMKTSAKTFGRIKVGYGQKNYDDPGLNDTDNLLAEAQFYYYLTPKKSLYLRGLRRVFETDSVGYKSTLTNRIEIGYRQRFTVKLTGETAVYYRNDNYDRAGAGDDREDDYYGFTAALGFSPKSWLNCSLGYEYKDRDSNLDNEDYKNNTVFARVTIAH